MPEPIIRIEQVGVEYPDGRSVRRVLNGVDLEIQSGEFISIVGQTGCGKSTLLRLILGEQKPTRGRVLVNGFERTQPDRPCGYVPQKYSLFSDKTVLDNVTFGPDVAEFGAFAVLNPKRRSQITMRRQGRSHAFRAIPLPACCA